MDPAEARRQAQTLEALRRLEDMVGDLRSTMFDGHKQILQQALGIRNDLAVREREAQLEQEGYDLATESGKRVLKLREAEARVARLEEALREIQAIGDDTFGYAGRKAGEVARRALAREESAE